MTQLMVDVFAKLLLGRVGRDVRLGVLTRRVKVEVLRRRYQREECVCRERITRGVMAERYAADTHEGSTAILIFTACNTVTEFLGPIMFSISVSFALAIFCAVRKFSESLL